MSEQDCKIPEDFMVRLSHYVNSCSRNDKEIAKAVADRFVREHRTLQQNMLRLLCACIIETASRYPEICTHTDARNQASIVWLKKIAEASKDDFFPLI